MKVLVECNADEMVLRNLGITRKQLFHFAGRNNVISHLKDLPGAIGVVDEDPGSSQHRDQQASYHQVKFSEGLRLLTRQGSGGQKLIIVCPKLEDWLLDRAKSSGIKPENFGFPNDPDRLHGIPRYEQKEGFKRFLEELKEKDKGMKLLCQWIFENVT